MSAAPSSPPRSIEFSSASLGTTIARLKMTDAPLLADDLHKMLGGMPDFFSGEAAILDFAEVAHLPARIDWAGLLSLFRRFQLQPIGVRHLPPELAAAARQAGLAVLDGIGTDETQRPPGTDAVADLTVAPSPPESAPAPEPTPEPLTANTVFVDRPLRSGQQVYARGADVVLLAGMSNGAEVIADGSIHCYGPLRGRALAGAQGNGKARIITTNFGPEIVSIAGVYKTFESGISAALAGRPAHVRLNGAENEQTLGIEPLTLD